MASQDYLRKYMSSPPKPKKKKKVVRNIKIHDDDAGWEAGAPDIAEKLLEDKPVVVEMDNDILGSGFRGKSTFKPIGEDPEEEVSGN